MMLAFFVCVAFSPDGRYIVAGDFEMFTLDVGFPHSEARGELEGPHRLCLVCGIYTRWKRVEEWGH